MPKKKPQQLNFVTALEGSAATAATAKYHAKVGLISKSYKLNRELVEAFAEACEEKERSQAAVLTAYMVYYIRKHHPDGAEALPTHILRGHKT